MNILWVSIVQFFQWKMNVISINNQKKYRLHTSHMQMVAVQYQSAAQLPGVTGKYLQQLRINRGHCYISVLFAIVAILSEITGCTFLCPTLKFTIEISLGNNKAPARVSTNTLDSKLKSKCIVKVCMDLFWISARWTINKIPGEVPRADMHSRYYLCSVLHALLGEKILIALPFKNQPWE